MYRFGPEVRFGNALQALAEAQGAQPDPDGRWACDLSACSRFDSSLLSVLLELARRASDAGALWHFDGANPALRGLAELYGIAELLFGSVQAQTRSGGIGANGLVDNGLSQ